MRSIRDAEAIARLEAEGKPVVAVYSIRMDFYLKRQLKIFCAERNMAMTEAIEEAIRDLLTKYDFSDACITSPVKRRGPGRPKKVEDKAGSKVKAKDSPKVKTKGQARKEKK